MHVERCIVHGQGPHPVGPTEFYSEIRGDERVLSRGMRCSGFPFKRINLVTWGADWQSAEAFYNNPGR